MDLIHVHVGSRITSRIAYPVCASLAEIQEDLPLPIHHSKMTKGGGHWWYCILSESSQSHHHKHPEKHLHVRMDSFDLF